MFGLYSLNNMMQGHSSRGGWAKEVMLWHQSAFFYFAWQFWKLASIVRSAPRPLQWPQPLTNMTILQIEHVQHINTTSKVSFSHQMSLNFNISYILCRETICVSIWFPDVWISTNYKFILKLFVLSIDLARTGIIFPAARETTPIKNV